MREVLAYLMAVGLQAVYKGPSALLQKLVLDKGVPYLFSSLVYAQNQKNWLYAIVDALDPAGPLQLKAQLNLNIEALIVWIHSTWVNVAGITRSIEPQPAPWFSLPIASGYPNVGGNRRPDPSNCPNSMANLRCSHGLAIPNTSPASGSKCHDAIHPTLCKHKRIPAGSNLSITSTKFCKLTTSHGLHRD